ncbi:response regulator [bacterium]|nr:response regulator [bacterium]
MSDGRILVIEDNFDNLELVRFLLENAGFTVIAAHDGLEGLSVARMILPDLVLTDLTLPEIDGWSLAQQLKGDQLTMDIPVVALTAHTLPGDRQRALESGCDGYLSKPLDIPSFIPSIRHYLKRRQGS